MDNGKFILCRNCGSVHHVSPFDKAPAYDLAGANETPADDWRAFMDRHAGHGLEPLKAVGDQYFPEGSPSDPMAVAYLKVTNGQREYLLRRSRLSITEPLSFELIEGSLDMPVLALEVQEREIRKELNLRFRPNDSEPFSEAKVDLFVALFRAVAAQVDARNLTDAEPSYSNDNIMYAGLDGCTIESLLKQCASHFLPEEVQALRRFVEFHSAGSDVMTLVLRRRMTVTELKRSA